MVHFSGRYKWLASDVIAPCWWSFLYLFLLSKHHLWRKMDAEEGTRSAFKATIMGADVTPVEVMYAPILRLLLDSCLVPQKLSQSAKCQFPAHSRRLYAGSFSSRCTYTRMTKLISLFYAAASTWLFTPNLSSCLLRMRGLGLLMKMSFSRSLVDLVMVITSFHFYVNWNEECKLKFLALESSSAARTLLPQERQPVLALVAFAVICSCEKTYSLGHSH